MLKLVLIRIPASAAFVRQLVEEGFLIVADICNALCTLCPFIPCKKLCKYRISCPHYKVSARKFVELRGKKWNSSK